MDSVIDSHWFKEKSSEDYFKSIFYREKRKKFGLLEQPSLPPQKVVDIVNYKIFVCGKANVGKTATIAKLAGCKVQKNFCETAGIEVTSMYWPARLCATGKVVFFCLNFWDVGDNAIKKFDHIWPACLEDADCILYLYSFTDRSSFTELAQYLNNSQEGSSKKPAEIIIGTKADQYIHSDISETELQALSDSRNLPILRSKNLIENEGFEQIKDVAPILNKICEQVLHRDQTSS